MSFTINNIIEGSISHIETLHTVPAGQAPRGTYFEIIHYKNVCWYVKNHYKEPSPPFTGNSTIYLTDKFGNKLEEILLSHTVFRIKRSSFSNNFLTLSFDLNLHYFPNDGSHYLRNLSTIISDRFHAKCIDLTENGDAIFCSNWDSIICFDPYLRPLETWKIPSNISPQNMTSSKDITNALLLLELNENPTNDEIKSAFRRQLLRSHPDVNVGDPYALEKTRDIVNAYELLSHNSPYGNTKQQEDNFIDVQLAFSGDSITSSRIMGNTQNLFVGCYSGRLYLFDSHGKGEVIFQSSSPIRSIEESEKYLYIFSENSCDILLNKNHVNHILGRFIDTKIRFNKGCIALIYGSDVQFYSPGGIYFADLKIKENIADLFIHNDLVKVITGKKTYIFSIIPPVDYKILIKRNYGYLPSSGKI